MSNKVLIDILKIGIKPNKIDAVCFKLPELSTTAVVSTKNNFAAAPVILSKSNLLKNSPHTLEMVTSDKWNFEYSRTQAAYPLDFTKDNKFWASVRRVDDAYGDRNLICSCAPIESYTE